MTMFKVGDKVRVKTDLVMLEKYYGERGVGYLSLWEGMAEGRGMVGTVVEVQAEGMEIYYSLDGAFEILDYSWVSSMLELADGGTK
ncbi:MAG: hypothetical protein ACRCX8_14470 [Sarcina sp.]